ncbi:MAG: hypothetical protein M1815_001261 [Lichina confinis]|nr:MAG: hypothetical protein M1815_001261 [Lichina confinis]
MPPKGAKRHSATQHHARHEAGLAQPGKRIDRQAKQKQQQQQQPHQSGQNATVNAASQRPPSSEGPSHMPPRHDLSRGSEDGWASSGASVDAGGSATTATTTTTGPADKEVGLVKRASQHAQSDTAHDGWARSMAKPEITPRRIDVNAPGNPAVHRQQRGPFHRATRLIASWPLVDTLAILIILLQTPPASLTAIQLLYATMTLAPHVSSSASFGPYGDSFASAGSASSLTAMLLADIAVFAVWLCLWTPAQNLFVEFAHAVIATSLGGRSDDRDSGIKSAVVCVGITVATHLSRGVSGPPVTGSPWTSATFSSLDDLPAAYVATRPTHAPLPGRVRVISGLHILGQGILGISRRLALGYQGDGSSRPAGEDFGVDRGPNGIATGIASVSRAREVQRARAGSTSKRESALEFVGKQCGEPIARVRTFQPFWAAAANVKAFVTKEYRSSQAANEVAAAQAKDLKELGNASFPSERGRVWATGVDSTEIVFHTSSFDIPADAIDAVDAAKPTDTGQRARENGHAVSQLSRPFHVRIDEARWPSVRIMPAEKDGDAGEAAHGDWIVEVYGLAPGSSYVCEFRRSPDDELMYRVNFSTPNTSAPDSDVNSGSPSSAVPKTLGPSSPTTTLLKSLSSAETKLDEERNAVKKLRRDHKAHLAALKKEVDGYSTRSSSCGNDDDRQRHRLQQIGHHIRQAEDAAAVVQSRFEEMGEVPEEDMAEWRGSRERWDAVREERSQAHEELTEQATRSDREKTSLQSEASNVQQKKERVQARHAKLTDQHERLHSRTGTDANAAKAGAEERDRTAALPRSSEDEHRSSIMDHYTGQVQHLHRTLQEIQLGGQHLWQQIRMIEKAYCEQKHMLTSAAPQQPPLRTPDSGLAGVVGIGHSSTAPSGRFGNFSLPVASSSTSSSPSPLVSSAHISVSARSAAAPLYQHAQEGRVRSSSMRSNRSGLAPSITAASATPEYAELPPLTHNSGNLSYDHSTAMAKTVSVNGFEYSTPPPSAPRDLRRGDSGGSGSGTGSAAGGGSGGGSTNKGMPPAATSGGTIGSMAASSGVNRSRSSSHRDRDTSSSSPYARPPQHHHHPHPHPHHPPSAPSHPQSHTVPHHHAAYSTLTSAAKGTGPVWQA